MLIAHGILPDLLSHLSSYSGFGIAPIFFDQAEGQFKVKKSAITCIGTVVSFQLGLCLIVHDLYQHYHQNTNGINNNASGGSTIIPNSSGETVITSSFGSSTTASNWMEKTYNRTQRLSCALLLLFVALIHGRNMRSAHALAAFFNGLIAFEQKYTGRLRLPADWKGKLTKYFCLLVRLLNSIGPLLISVLITVSEAGSPLNLIEFLTSSSSYSAVSSQGEMGESTVGGTGTSSTGGGNNDLSGSSCSIFSGSIGAATGNQLVQRFITGTLTALLNIVIWYGAVNIRGFWTCGQILIGCYGIRSALNLYASIMTRGKLLRITKEKIQEALIFREIQLLSQLFNEVHGNSIFVILVLISSLLQTISLYIYVQFIATMSNSFYIVPSSWTWTSSRLFIAYMVFDGIFTVVIVFGCCAEVYITSVQVKAQLQENDVFQRSEWFTQFFLSCPTIKLDVGSTNFISEGQFGCGNSSATPANFMDTSSLLTSSAPSQTTISALKNSSSTSDAITSIIMGENGSADIAAGAKLASVIGNSNGNSNCSGTGLGASKPNSTCLSGSKVTGSNILTNTISASITLPSSSGLGLFDVRLGMGI